MKLNESILRNLKESEGRNYEVVVGFCGYIGVEQEYNVYAKSKADAACEALDNPGSEAEMELSADEITDNGDGTFDVTVSYAGLIGAENTYTVTAEDESEAEMYALEEAKGDLEILSIDGEEFSYDETFESSKIKNKKEELKEDTEEFNEGKYEEERNRLKEIADRMQSLLSEYCNEARVTSSHDGERMKLDINSCRFAPENFSRYENEPQIYGSVELDKDFNFVNVDINTTSGPNIMNRSFISALNALYTFIASKGDHYEG